MTILSERRRTSDRRRRLAEEREHDLRVQQQTEEAIKRTHRVEQRLQRLTGLLRAALLRPVEPLSFTGLKITSTVPALDLGADARPIPAPAWEDYLPAPGRLGRVRRDGAAQAAARQTAESAFADAVLRHQHAERARQERVRAAREHYHKRYGTEIRRVEQHNADVDAFRIGVLSRDRHAVADYFGRVLDGMRTARGMPTGRRAAYVPESRLLVIEQDLPRLGIIPAEREFRYCPVHDTVEVARSWRPEELRRLYQNLLAQIALRTLRQVFLSDPGDVVWTVVFNGCVDGVESPSGRPVRPCLITLRAGRARFRHLRLDRVDPLGCVRKHFGAHVSPHPEGLAEVRPYLDLDLVEREDGEAERADQSSQARPGAASAAPAARAPGRQPDLLGLSPVEFARLVQQLLTRMGLQVRWLRPDGAGGLDCRVYDPGPLGGYRVVRVRHTTRLLRTAAVRELVTAVRRERAVSGLLITTSGFSADCYQYANGRPVQLYDGSSLLALCRRHHIHADLPPVEARALPPVPPARRLVERLRVLPARP